MMSGWICKENLEPFYDMVATLVDYKLDDYDWTSIRYGVEDATEQDHTWFEYPLHATRSVSIATSMADDGAVALIHVESEDELSPDFVAQLDLLFLVCETYKLK